MNSSKDRVQDEERRNGSSKFHPPSLHYEGTRTPNLKLQSQITIWRLAECHSATQQAGSPRYYGQEQIFRNKRHIRNVVIPGWSKMCDKDRMLTCVTSRDEPPAPATARFGAPRGRGSSPSSLHYDATGRVQGRFEWCTIVSIVPEVPNFENPLWTQRRPAGGRRSEVGVFRQKSSGGPAESNLVKPIHGRQCPPIWRVKIKPAAPFCSEN